MKITAIVPVYNNETTIDHVAKTLRDHPKIAEVIVVNDASADASGEILKSISGIRVITHKKNKGKGATISRGWQVAHYETLLTVDADMSRLSCAHIDDMIAMYETGGWDMVIAYHDPSTVFDWLSGQRIYKKSKVMPYAKLAVGVGNGIEQVINYAHRDKRVTMVYTNNIGHILKYHRHPPHTAAFLYIKESWQLAKTEYLLRKYRVISFVDLAEFPYLPIRTDFMRNIPLPSVSDFSNMREMIVRSSKLPKQKLVGLIEDTGGVVKKFRSGIRKLRNS